MDKKTLSVPYIASLDNMDIESIATILEELGARRTIDSLNWSEQYPYHPLTTFSMAHSGTHIYIDFFVRCNYLKAVNYENQSPVSQDSCVEFFVAPQCDNHYWNFEFNCIGTVNASHRETREYPTRLNDNEISQIKRYASCGTRPFEEMEGIFSWNLIIAIPFSLIGINENELPEKILGNFYKCGSKTSNPHLLSWSPIVYPKPDFHRPEFFGELFFTEK